MKVQVTGKGIKISEYLRKHIEESLESHVIKYFSNAINARAVIHKESYTFHVDVSVNEGVSHSVFIKASAISNHVYTAVDKAIVKASGKLRRYKHKIQDYNKPKAIKAAQYTVSQDFQNENHEQSDDFSHITEEKSIEIQFLSIAEAVMHLELTLEPALMFINKSNNQLNMVYKKKDGNITWVEAPNSLEKLSSLASR
ncbi:MAG: ribosome-associated translation inhibitor RaiA [Rickettsiaceae bacterium H1]|nr:ribosome-associated translation inhibitor RaiA [Rickettsiaceae bacterium H1]